MSDIAARAAESRQRALAFLDSMTRTRTLDTTATSLQRQGELALWPSSLGQEAAQAGISFALLADDVVFPTYRDHGILLARGILPGQILSLYRGNTHGGWDPHRTNTFLSTLVIGAQTLHAVGYAMGIVRDAHDAQRDAPCRAVLVCLGDGAFSQGETNEAFVWASTHKLPIVFFCQNNQWAISTPSSAQSIIPFADRAKGFGFPGLAVDGNDPEACYATAQAGLDQARRGAGPTLIEAVTYRINPHTTADDDLRYRSDQEKSSWRERDPLEMLKRRLRSEFDDVEVAIDECEESARRFASQVRAECLDLSEPDPMDPFRFTSTQMSSDLYRQAVAFTTDYSGAGHS